MKFHASVYRNADILILQGDLDLQFISLEAEVISFGIVSSP